MIDPPKSSGLTPMTGAGNSEKPAPGGSAKPPQPLEADQTADKALSDRQTTASGNTSSLKPENHSPEKLRNDYTNAVWKKESLEHQTYLAREAGIISQLLNSQHLTSASPRVLIVHIGGDGEMTNVIPPDESMNNPAKSSAICKSLAKTFAAVNQYYTEDRKQQLGTDLKSAVQDLEAIKSRLVEHGIAIPTTASSRPSALALNDSNRGLPLITPDRLPAPTTPTMAKPATHHSISFFADQSVHAPTSHQPVTQTELPVPKSDSAPAKSKRKEQSRSCQQQQTEPQPPITEPHNHQEQQASSYKIGRKKIKTATINPYTAPSDTRPTSDRMNRAALTRLGSMIQDQHDLTSPLSTIPGIDPKIDVTGKQGLAHSARKAILFPILMNCMKAWQHPEAIQYANQALPLYQLALATAVPDSRGVLEQKGSVEQQRIIREALVGFNNVDPDMAMTVATDVSGTNMLFEDGANPSPLAASPIRDIERFERTRFVPELNIEALESFNLIKAQLESEGKWSSAETNVRRQFIDICESWLKGLNEQGELLVNCQIKSKGKTAASIMPKAMTSEAPTIKSPATAFTSQKELMLKQPALAHFYEHSTLPRSS